MNSSIRNLVKTVSRRPGHASAMTRSDRARTRLAARRLERQLAEYRAPSERLELDAILARYSEEDTLDVRRVLDRQGVSAEEVHAFHLQSAR